MNSKNKRYDYDQTTKFPFNLMTRKNEHYRK